MHIYVTLINYDVDIHIIAIVAVLVVQISDDIHVIYILMTGFVNI